MDIKHYCNVMERRIVRVILKNESIAKWLSKHWLRLYLRLFYFNWQNKHIHYRHPQDLNQWLLKTSWLNSKNPQMRELIPQCVDKYTVREYIMQKGYADTLNECYGVYERVEDIDFKSLPRQFVMKMTNASGRNYICTDKSQCDWQQVSNRFTEWLKDNMFGWQSGEWQYALIKPRIVVEKFLENLGESSLIDYKFNVINGKVYSCFVAYNRDNNDAHSRQVCFDDYDLEWNRTDAIKDSWHTNRKLIVKPKTYDRMIEMAEVCSKEFPYCRFDVYEIEGKILFGEMTFTPQGNVLEFYKDEWLRNALKVIK